MRKLKADRDDPLLRLNNFNVWKENVKHKVSEREANRKAIKASVKQQDQKAGLLQKVIRVLHETDKKIMRRCDEQKPMIGGSVRKLLETVAMHFAGR